MIDYALNIGVNRYGNGSDLFGCINDALDWAAALKARGAQTYCLTNEDATGEGIRDAMREMISRIKRGHTGVITYSGHGTWLPDADGDEADHRDEAICPVDLWDRGVITDDELFTIFSARPYGSRLVFISDSCHSGTVARLAGPLTYHVVDRHDTADGWEPVTMPTRLVRYLAPETFLHGAALKRAVAIGHAKGGRSRTTALLLAGCRDTEYSYDAWFPQNSGPQRANGAFTRGALDALVRMPVIATYTDWLTDIRRTLPSQDYPQQPMLVGTAEQRRWPLF